MFVLEGCRMMLRDRFGRIVFSMGAGAFAMACGGGVKASSAGREGGAKSTTSDSDAAATADSGRDVGASVLEHHVRATRDGAYIDPNLTKTAAAAVHIDSAFKAQVTGNIYGHPLYVDGWKVGQDAVFVATDQNHVTALDAASGAALWDVTLGPPIALTSLPCGGPYESYGVMSTPVIDLASRTLYVESAQTPDDGTTKKRYVYALSIDTGKTQTGWPVDVGAKVTGFDPDHQNDRGGLTILNGTVYVPYAGLNGDCNPYHGWVVGVSTTDPTKVGAYSTSGSRGGIWGAVSSDGTSLYAVTGNTLGATTWGGGEALLRIRQSNDGGVLSITGPTSLGAAATDYFTPSNWMSLDSMDADLGSSAAVLFDVPGATPSTLAVAMGKFGVVHLLNRAKLGGAGTGDGKTGEGLFSLYVGGGLFGTAASYASSKGRYVVLNNQSTVTVCPNGTSGDLLALHVTATSPPTLVPAWCAISGGHGSPIATTTDGASNALVWDVSAEGSNRLFAFDGDTGAVVFAGGGAPEQLGTVYHWTSAVVAKGRFIVGGAGAVYAFTAL
jgi:hypothetical protein